MNTNLYRITDGDFHVGLIGTIEPVNKNGLCFFHPVCGKPYRVCVRFENLVLVEGDNK